MKGSYKIFMCNPETGESDSFTRKVDPAKVAKLVKELLDKGLIVYAIGYDPGDDSVHEVLPDLSNNGRQVCHA